MQNGEFVIKHRHQRITLEFTQEKCIQLHVQVVVSHSQQIYTRRTYLFVKKEGSL